MRLCLPLLLLVGCAFDRSGLGSDDVGPIDAPAGDGAVLPDAIGDDGAPGCLGWDALNVDPCDPALPEPDTINLASGKFRYNTDSGVLTDDGGLTSMPASTLLAQSSGPEVRVINTIGFNLDANGALVVVGSRPLIIVVHGSASIAGSIDVSAQVDSLANTSEPGPGGNGPECGNSVGGTAGAATNPAAGGGGGGGGGFGEDGGDGGDGHGGGHGPKGGKGGKSGNTALEPLRGGCAGGPGGDDADPVIDASGRAGDGGGAIEITARGTVSVTGSIVAGGSGGAAAQLTNAGGGGAGSGGAILLDGDSAVIDAAATLCANGGGGGEGGQTLEAAEDGEFATCSETVEAQGGELSTDGGNGGDGGALSDVTGDNAANGANGGGGGGGGGGVGRIRVRGRSNRDVPAAAIVSPDAEQ